MVFPFPTCGAESLLLNSDFSQKGRNGVAAKWMDNSGWADVDVSYSNAWDPEIKKHYQKITCSRYGRGAVQFGQMGFKVEANESYLLTFWTKGDLVKPLQVHVMKRRKPFTRYAKASVKVHREWKKHELVLVASKSDDMAFFMFRFREEGSLSLADVSFRKYIPSKDDGMAPRGNLLANGSFEVGFDRWAYAAAWPGGKYNNHKGIDYGYFSMKNPEISSENTFDGARSAKFTVMDGTAGVLTSPFIKLAPGQQYTLKCRIRALKRSPVAIQISAGPNGKLDTHKKSMKVSQKWSEIGLTFTAKPVPDQRYFVKIRFASGGVFYVDGVELRRVNDSAPSPPSVGIKIADYILRPGDTSKASIGVSSETPLDGKLVVSIVDYYGATTELLNRDVELKPGRPIDIPVNHRIDKTGYYLFKAVLTSPGNKARQSEKSCVVVPSPNRSADSPFGTHFYISPSTVNDAASLGASWLRLNPQFMTRWSKIEQVKGDFRFYDEPILAAHEGGLKMLGLLYRTPRWASQAPARVKDHWKKGFGSYPAKDMGDWERYVRKIVARYKGKIDHWEVWNEPDVDYFTVAGGRRNKPQLYVELLKVAYKAAKKVNPDATIVAGSGTLHPHTKWAESIFKLGALDYMDALSIHRYTEGGAAGDQVVPTTGKIVRDLRALMQEYGKVVPIWESESGLLQPESGYSDIHYVSNIYKTPVGVAPGYFVRNMAYLLSLGVEKWFYYGMFTSNRIDFNGSTSIFEWDGSPRPLAAAYAVMAHLLSDAKFTRSYTPTPGVTSILFKSGNDSIEVVWAQKKEARVSVDNWNKGDVKFLNLMGNEVSPTSGSILVGLNPIYIVIKK
jgi:hypothetical protein